MQIRGMETEEFLDEVKKFHGHLAPGMVCGGFMVELAMRNLPEDGFFDVISETGACLPDAVQLLTPCTIGNGWLKIINTGRFAMIFYDKYTGDGIRVALDPEKLDEWPETKIWAMKLKPKKEQDKDRLFKEIIDAEFSIYKTEKVVVDLDGFSKKGEINICTSCGESFRTKSGDNKCLACSDMVPFHPRAIKKKLLKTVPVENAVGKTALHDMTKVKTGLSKGAAIKKGDELKNTDIDLLKSMGKENIYIDQDFNKDGLIHENKAALAFASKIAGENVSYGDIPHEGKIDFLAESDGVLCIDTKKLLDFNRSGNVICSTRKNYMPVKKGMSLGGTRAVPLYLSKNDFDSAINSLGASPVLKVVPFRLKKLGIVITGTEVYKGRIKDGFTEIIESVAAKYSLEITDKLICPDDSEEILAAVKKLISMGSEIIVLTGGLSVDPDDVTREALLKGGLKDEIYGTPVLPGAMTLIGSIGNTRIIGVPAGALYFAETAFDLLFPRLVADIPMSRLDIAQLAEGGFLDPNKR